MTTPSASQPPAMSDICASCDLPRSVHPTGDCRGFVAGAPLLRESLPLQKVWDCQIGVMGDLDLPDGVDYPMRRAIQKAFVEVTGREAQFTFSGWGGTLTEERLAVVEDRLPLRAVASAMTPLKEWRCFHCDEVFTDEALAAEHFGEEIYHGGDAVEYTSAACQLKLTEGGKCYACWSPLGSNAECPLCKDFVAKRAGSVSETAARPEPKCSYGYGTAITHRFKADADVCICGSVDRFGSSVRAGTSEVAASVLSEEAAPPTNALDEDLLGRVRALLAKPPREFVKLERADFARLYELSRLRSLVSQPVADKVIATLKHDGDGFYVTWHEVSHGGIKSRACTGDYDTQRGAIEGYLEEAEQNA